MTNVVVHHNPLGSKSRAALALLREHDIEPEIVAYLTIGRPTEALLALLQ